MLSVISVPSCGGKSRTERQAFLSGYCRCIPTVKVNRHQLRCVQGLKGWRPQKTGGMANTRMWSSPSCYPEMKVLLYAIGVYSLKFLTRLSVSHR